VSVELLEFKAPSEKTLTHGFHPGFTAKVHRAIDQVRDYGRYLSDQTNVQAVLQALGYLPDNSKLAVLIGRSPKNEADKEVWTQRQSELNVKVVTYDEILETRANQLRDPYGRGPYKLRYGTPMHPLDE
jgi:hypothetical protein